MPQFNGQNKKKIDPRYFSEELLEEQANPWEDKPKEAVPAAFQAPKQAPMSKKKSHRQKYNEIIVGMKKKGYKGDDLPTYDQVHRFPAWKFKQYYEGYAGAAEAEKGARAKERQAKKQLVLQYFKLRGWDPKDPNKGFSAMVKTVAAADIRAGIDTVAAKKKAPASRRGSKLYAKGPTAGKIQGLLLKAFGVMAESKILSEANIRSVLGSRKIDGKIGPTTLKSMQKIPAITGLVNTPSDLKDPENIKAILNALQKCAQGGFKDPKCKPRGKITEDAYTAPALAQRNKKMAAICKKRGKVYDASRNKCADPVDRALDDSGVD